MTIPARLKQDMEAALSGAPHQDRVSAALALVRDVENRPGREAAYQLLAADALLTEACGAAATAPDPESTLRDVLSRSLEALG